MRLLYIAAALLLLANGSQAATSFGSGRRMLGRNRCTWGPSYWCQHLGTMKECGSTRYCPKIWKASQPPAASTSPSDCTQCMQLVRMVRKMHEDNVTEALIHLRARRFCVSKDSALCHSVIDTYPAELLRLVAYGLEDGQMCQALSLCGLTRPDPKLLQRRQQVARVILVRQRQLANGSAICNDCLGVLNTVKKAVEDNKTEAEISAIVKASVCSMLGPLAGTCNLLIDEYLPQVMAMLDKDIQPQQICSLLGFCRASGVVSTGKARRLAQLVKLQRSRSKPLQGVECTVCESFVAEARTMIRNNNTEAEIMQFIKTRVCTLVPSITAKCTQLVTEYSAIIFQLLASELEPSVVCQALGACPSQGAITRRPLQQRPRTQPRVSPQCILCEYVIRELQRLMGDNKTEASIEYALESVCSVMPSTIRAECNSFVEQYAPAVIELLANELNPELVCSTIGICASAEAATPMPERLLDSTACDICQTVVMYAKNLMEKNDTEQYLINLIGKVCNFVPAAERPQCQAFIGQYGDAVIRLLLQEVQPEAVCQKLRLCSAGVNAHAQRLYLCMREVLDLDV